MIATLEKHQLAILIVFIPLVFKMAMLPCLLYQTVGSDMWMSVLLLLSLEILQLFAILGIQKLGGVERLKKAVGKQWYRLMILPLAFVFVVKAVIFFNEIVNYVSSFMFYNISDWSVRIALLIGIGYLAVKGVKAMGRLGELSLIFLPFIFIIGLSFGKVDLKFEYLLPLFEKGAKPIFEGAWQYLFYAFDFSPLIFIGIAQKKKSPPPKEKGLNLNINHRKKTFPWYVFSAAACIVTVVGAYFVFIASYGDAGYLIDNAFARLASFNVVTTEIGSIDWPAVILWLTMAVLTVSLKVWGMGAVGDAFGVNRDVSIFVTVGVIGLLSWFVFKNVTEGIVFLESWWRFVIVGVEVIVTAAILIALLVDKKIKKSKKAEVKNAA